MAVVVDADERWAAGPKVGGRVSPLRSVELFTGAGGFALGLHLAGFRHEALVERDPDACETLRANVDGNTVPGVGNWDVRQADVCKEDFRTFAGVDLIAGGPACQPFSIAGQHGGRTDRRNLLPEFIRCVRTVGPRAFVLENVDGLLRSMFADYFEYALLQLEKPEHERRLQEQWRSHRTRLREESRYNGLRYHVQVMRLNAADFGVAQARRRVFVAGVREDVCGPRPPSLEPTATHSRTTLLYDQWKSGDYWASRHLVPVKQPSGRLAAAVRTLPTTRPTAQAWVTIRDALEGLPTPGTAAADALQHRLRDGARRYAGHSGSAIDMPAKTIKAGDHGVPGGENMLDLGRGVRYLTVREMARLQSFPDAWRFIGTWVAVTKQLGNAVPVTLGSLMGERIAALLTAPGRTRESGA